MVGLGLLHMVGVQIVTVGLLAKAHGHLLGLRHDELVARLYRWFTFERAFLGSTALALVACLIAGGVVVEGVYSGCGTLNRAWVLSVAAAPGGRRPVRDGLLSLLHHGAASAPQSASPGGPSTPASRTCSRRI